jgi:hypothetical protein
MVMLVSSLRFVESLSIINAQYSDVLVSNIVEFPSMQCHTFSNFDQGVSRFTFTLSTSTDTPFLYIALKGYAPETQYVLTITTQPQPFENIEQSEERVGDGQTCSNCLKQIPQSSFAIHMIHCERNIARCAKCNAVMSRGSLEKHNAIYHVPMPCLCAQLECEYADIMSHKERDCPQTVIVCRFCHLKVHQGTRVTDGRDILLGIYNEHEATCGGRTIECQLCRCAVRMKDVQTHFQWHQVEKQNKPKPFVLCANQNCSNAVMLSHPNVLKLCQSCFGPFYSPRIDEGNKKLIQSLITKYFEQMTKGCGKSHCWNKVFFCTGLYRYLTQPSSAGVPKICPLIAH